MLSSAISEAPICLTSNTRRFSPSNPMREQSTEIFGLTSRLSSLVCVFMTLALIFYLCKYSRVIFNQQIKRGLFSCFKTLFSKLVNIIHPTIRRLLFQAAQQACSPLIIYTSSRTYFLCLEIINLHNDSTKIVWFITYNNNRMIHNDGNWSLQQVSC